MNNKEKSKWMKEQFNYTWDRNLKEEIFRSALHLNRILNAQETVKLFTHSLDSHYQSELREKKKQIYRNGDDSRKIKGGAFELEIWSTVSLAIYRRRCYYSLKSELN